MSESSLPPSDLHAIRKVGEVYLAVTAVVVGEVRMGEDCNIWHHCVIRGDVAPIRLGRRVNVQDGSILHCRHDVPLEIDDDVAIGHGAIIHGRHIGTRTLIGIRATVLDNCEIGADCLIAAGTVVAPGAVIPPGSLVMGVPGKVIRPIREDEREYIRYVVEAYLRLAREHLAGRFPPWPPPDPNPA